MSDTLYDVIILGAGPAGITAGVYASRKQLTTLIISEDIGGQTAWSGDIENYTGYQFITGEELALKFQKHIDTFNIPTKMPESVLSLAREKDSVIVKTNKSSYRARTAIVATGKRPKPLNVTGEKEFKNKGLSYCATCDGPLFRDKPIAVIGGGNSALDAVLSLIKICPKIYVINITGALKADKVMVDKIKRASNVEVWNNSYVTDITGDTFVNNIRIRKHQKDFTLSVRGVFVEIGLIPNSECASICATNKTGEIIVDSQNRTDIEGIFAAGDVTNVIHKQIIIACGEGSKALLGAFTYLSRRAL